MPRDNNDNHPRHPLVATFFSCLLPGWGQLYNGDLNKALYYLMAYLFLSPVIFLFATLLFTGIEVMDGLLVWLLITALLWLFSIIDAWKTARKRQQWQLYSWQLSGVYLAVLVTAHLLCGPIITKVIRSTLVESFKVPSGSMEPNIYAGDILFADKRYNCAGCIETVKRGDVVIFIYPNDRTQYFIKRVIGLPGDQVRIQGDHISINDTSLLGKRQSLNGVNRVDEYYETKQWQVVWRAEPLKQPQVNFNVPNGEIFVMGDNRSSSNDSRYFGTIPLSDVVGKATLIWFSSSKGKLNWQRMGLAIH